MEENKNVAEAVAEIKDASEEEIKGVIEKWFESTHTDGMKLGAYYISAAVYGAIEKNLKKGSLRDYQRAIKRVREIVSVQLTKQNDLATEEITEQDGDEV
jgi:hypothetical protein